MIVYIAGKIRGCENYRERFKEAELYLRTRGHIPLNPANLPNNMPDNRYLPICMAMIDQADGMYLLNNWEDSEGARIEREYALYQRMWITYERAK